MRLSQFVYQTVELVMMVVAAGLVTMITVDEHLPSLVRIAFALLAMGAVKGLSIRLKGKLIDVEDSH